MTSIILLAVGIVVGVPLGALWCARRPIGPMEVVETPSIPREDHN